MSLADELLADLEEGEEEQDIYDVNMDKDIEDVDDIDEESNKKQYKDSVFNIAKLWDSDQLKSVMIQIEEKIKQQEDMGFEMSAQSFEGIIENHHEYQLIVEANNLAVEIENEINVIHKYIRDVYTKRFPELESLIPTPLEYILTVKELGNDLEKSKSSSELQKILTHATIMVVSVTASTTQGTLLEDNEFKQVDDACDLAINLNDAKMKILHFVESRMMFIAPNLTFIVGSTCAAKLMGGAGGLSKLSKIPSANFMVIGAQKKILSGFSSTALNPHLGYIFMSPIVQSAPPDLRRKLCRLVGNKCALASRVDSFHQNRNGLIGQQYVDLIKRYLDKLQEPPAVKQIKPLPAPTEGPKKRRGGRKYRKMKERFGLTEMRKQANRMTFAHIEDDAYQEDLGFSLGNLASQSTGKIRAAQVDNKTQVKISKTLQKHIHKQNAHWKSGASQTPSLSGGRTTIRHGSSVKTNSTVCGTASSIAFTPLQGLEIVNPLAAEKMMDDSSAKYFSQKSGFINLNKKS
ncbi:unnamed protein product [Gordionus sp. m RMFG-2023]|uniref:U4/U6 small nuclear ribonucleoprotein Prp31-like n=1 Tax=Gordionus sp. m RMFG-2023 TaxID=3053472 RepID=UPI0030E2A05F